MKRLLCLLLGHRWVYTATFAFFGGRPPHYSAECKRCGAKVDPLFK